MYSLWNIPLEPLILDCDEVHVWRSNLDLEQSQMLGFLNTLSGDERSKAERFHFEKDRSHYIAARGVLRSILGQYLGVNQKICAFSTALMGSPG